MILAIVDYYLMKGVLINHAPITRTRMNQFIQQTPIPQATEMSKVQGKAKTNLNLELIYLFKIREMIIFY